MSETQVEPKKESGLSHFVSAYQRLQNERPGIFASESGGELDWLKKARERDFARWSVEGLPTRRNEKWMYTNVSALGQDEVTFAANAGAARPIGRANLVALSAPVTESSAEIVFVNGIYSAPLSFLPDEAGVTVTVLTELLAECVNEGWSAERKGRFERFRKEVESSDADRETVFSAMNTSFIHEGVLISVAAGIKVLKPIVLAYYVDLAAPGLVVTSPRIFVHLEKQAEAAILEVYQGADAQKYFTNAVTDLRVEEAAILNHCKVQVEGDAAYHIGTTRIYQARNSFCETFQFSFGAKLSRQDLHIGLDGQGAEAALDGLYMIGGKQHTDNHTRVDHSVPNTQSSQLYKGILDGESRAVFNGFVRIHPDAQKSNANQLNNNLMLSPKAEVDTKPELEIDADDVKAAHGATIGRIDPEHVFYLETRAIPKAQAVRLLARGFAQDVVFRIRNESLRNRIHALVDARFDRLQMDAILKEIQ